MGWAKLWDVSQFLGMDYVWYPVLGEWGVWLLCALTEFVFWVLLGSHYLIKAAGLVSSGGFAVPTNGMFERLCGNWMMLSKILGMGFVRFMFLGAWILGLCALTELLIWIFFGSIYQMKPQQMGLHGL